MANLPGEHWNETKKPDGAVTHKVHVDSIENEIDLLERLGPPGYHQNLSHLGASTYCFWSMTLKFHSFIVSNLKKSKKYIFLISYSYI